MTFAFFFVLLAIALESAEENTDLSSIQYHRFIVNCASQVFPTPGVRFPALSGQHQRSVLAGIV